MARFQIEELFDTKLVLRHTQRMSVWVKLLNLGKKSALANLATNQLGYTPSSYDSDFYYNMVTKQPDELFSLSKHGLVFTEEGEAFRKHLLSEAQLKYPLTINKVEALNAKKKDNNDSWYTCSSADRLIFHCTFGKTDINFMLLAEEEYNYHNTNRETTYRLSIRVNTSDKPKEYSYWGNAQRMKPVASHLLDSDSLTERFKAAIPENVKVIMAAWSLKPNGAGEPFRDFI